MTRFFLASVLFTLVSSFAVASDLPPFEGERAAVSAALAQESTLYPGSSPEYRSQDLYDEPSPGCAEQLSKTAGDSLYHYGVILAAQGKLVEYRVSVAAQAVGIEWKTEVKAIERLKEWPDSTPSLHPKRKWGAKKPRASDSPEA